VRNRINWFWPETTLTSWERVYDMEQYATLFALRSNSCEWWWIRLGVEL